MDKVLKNILGMVVFALLLAGSFFFTDIERQTSFPLEGDETVESVYKTSQEDWQWLLDQEKIYGMESEDAEELLAGIKKRFPEKEEQLKAISLARLDTPHMADCLGEESGRDRDPLFRIDKADCTSFIITNAALLKTGSIKEAAGLMKGLNYYPDKGISFESRLHFTTERNRFSPYFSDITEEVVPSDKIKTKTVLLNRRREDGKRMIDMDWEKEVQITYIPNQYLTQDLLNSFPKDLGVAFIREQDKQRGLDVAHEGFLFDNKTFIYTSSIYEKIVQVDFLEYYFSEEHVKFDGILLFEIK